MATRAVSPGTMLLIAGVAALSACASTDQGENPAEAAPAAPDCLYEGLISDYRVLDDRNLIVYAPTRRSPYHVELAVRCTGLRFADTIGVETRDSRLCGYGGDAIIVPETPAARRCTVNAVRALDPGEHDALLRRYGHLEEAVPPAEPEERVESPDAAREPAEAEKVEDQEP